MDADVAKSSVRPGLDAMQDGPMTFHSGAGDLMDGTGNCVI